MICRFALLPELEESLFIEQAQLATTQAIKVFRPQPQTASLPNLSSKDAHPEKQSLLKPPSTGLIDQRAPPTKHRLASGL
jgi:hypothetical protein